MQRKLKRPFGWLSLLCMTWIGTSLVVGGVDRYERAHYLPRTLSKTEPNSSASPNAQAIP